MVLNLISNVKQRIGSSKLNSNLPWHLNWICKLLSSLILKLTKLSLELAQLRERSDALLESNNLILNIKSYWLLHVWQRWHHLLLRHTESWQHCSHITHLKHLLADL